MTSTSTMAARDASRNEGGCERISESPVVVRPAYKFAKRALDLAIAIPGLAFLSPFLFIVAALVKLTSHGSVFYAWDVVGRGGRSFRGYKFRTMIPFADSMRGRLVAHNEMEGPVFKMRRDPRVTTFGRFLRKFSIDELPQLWSVIKGDMSLVGPRPAFASEWERYEPGQRRRLSVTPGITCLWQINGRNAIRNFDEWVRLDLEYIDHWSLGLDLSILARTVAAVLRGTGI